MAVTDALGIIFNQQLPGIINPVQRINSTYYNLHCNIVLDNFNHRCNNRIFFKRYISVEPTDDATQAGVNTVPQELCVFSNFFSLFSNNYQDQLPAQHILADLGTISEPFNQNDTWNITHTIGGQANQIQLQYQPGYLLYLYGTIIGDIPLRDYLRRSIQENFSKYIVSQLLYFFVNGFYDTTNIKGIRLYYDSYSMNLLKLIRYDITITIPWRDNLKHLSRQDNIDMKASWEILVNRINPMFQAEIADGIQINIFNRIDPSPEYDHSGIPINLMQRDIEITIPGGISVERRHAFIIKLFMFFACHTPERWAIRNTLFQYMEYFLHSDYVFNHTLIRNGNQEQFAYTKTWGFFGQFIRYISLGQGVGAPGQLAGSARPRIIHIRDAHHAIPTRLELNLLDSFRNNNLKRYLWAVGPTYAKEWHRTADEYFTNFPGGPTPFNDANAYGRQYMTGIRSVYCGLQSFKQLNDADACVFSHAIEPYLNTLGIIWEPAFFVGTFNANVLCDAYFGIRYRENNTVAEPAKFFTYGIDERILANCFYSVIEREPNNTYRWSTLQEKRLCLTYQQLQGATQYDQARAAAGAILWRINLYNESLFYSYALDYSPRMIARVFSFPGSITPDSSLICNEPLIPSQVDQGPEIEDIRENLRRYISVRGSYPRSFFDFIKFCEIQRDYNIPSSSPTTSAYHMALLLFRSYNVYITQGINIIGNSKFRTFNQTDMFNAMTTIYALPPRPLTTEKLYLNNYMFNISHFNKQALFNGTVPTLENFFNVDRPNLAPPPQAGQQGAPNKYLICYGTIKDSANLGYAGNMKSNNACFTQPIDLREDIFPRRDPAGVSLDPLGQRFTTRAGNTNTFINAIKVRGPDALVYGGGKLNTVQKKLNSRNTMSTIRMNTNNHQSNNKDYDALFWALENMNNVSYKELVKDSFEQVCRILEDEKKYLGALDKASQKWIADHPEIIPPKEYDNLRESPLSANILTEIGKLKGSFKTYNEWINPTTVQPFFEMFFKKGHQMDLRTLDEIEENISDIIFSKTKRNIPTMNNLRETLSRSIHKHHGVKHRKTSKNHSRKKHSVKSSIRMHINKKHSIRSSKHTQRNRKNIN
jgi:hypothetical protein